jgi:hypothetical protein
MDRHYEAADAIVVAIVAIAIIALLLFARGTPDHGRYGEGLLPVTPVVATI